MLAYPVNNKPIVYDKVSMQPKLDGVRCVIQHEAGAENPVKAYSRTGKEWKNINHILAELCPFFAKYPNVILDGELYNHDFKDDFESIISMVRKTKPIDEDRSISEKHVQFHCYDVIDVYLGNNKGEPTNLVFSERDKWLKDNLQSNHCIQLVNTWMVNEKQAREIHKANLRNGYEGSIVRLDTPYECKRSHSLRKFKDFSDAEANIVGYEEGKGKRTGTLGKFIMQDDDGNKFGCPPGKGHNYSDLANMLDNIHEYMGQRATFTYFERTKAGSYRHPLFKCIRNYE